jgi:hypothetical protein
VERRGLGGRGGGEENGGGGREAGGGTQGGGPQAEGRGTGWGRPAGTPAANHPPPRTDAAPSTTILGGVVRPPPPPPGVPEGSLLVASVSERTGRSRERAACEREPGRQEESGWARNFPKGVEPRAAR